MHSFHTWKKVKNEKKIKNLIIFMQLQLVEFLYSFFYYVFHQISFFFAEYLHCLKNWLSWSFHSYTEFMKNIVFLKNHHQYRRNLSQNLKIKIYFTIKENAKQLSWSFVNIVKVLDSQSCPSLCNPSKNTGVSNHFPLHEIFWTEGLNLSLLHCRWIIYCLSHQGSPSYSKVAMKHERFMEASW